MSSACPGCGEGKRLEFDFKMAFQPIVDLGTRSVWGYEALVRGVNGEGAATILAQVTDENRYRFDQACRVKAITSAGRLFEGRPYKLSINFLPNAVYEPAACIRASLIAADKAGLSRDQLMFEFTENEKLDVDKTQHIIEEYRRFGFLTALDDFGSGHAGLNLLATFQPSLIKLDLDLIRDVHRSKARQAIVAALATVARDLDITLLAEGVESEGEVFTLRAAGISLMQGYYFAKPLLEGLPQVSGLSTCADAQAA